MDVDDGMIECVVAPGRTIWSGPVDSAGTCQQAFGPGQTVRVTPADAEHLRGIGMLLLADGTPLIRGV